MTFVSLEDLFLSAVADLMQAESALFAARWSVEPIANAAQPGAIATTVQRETDVNTKRLPDPARSNENPGPRKTDDAVADFLEELSQQSAEISDLTMPDTDLDALERSAALAKLRFGNLISWINLVGFHQASDILKARATERSEEIDASRAQAGEGSIAARAS